MIIFAAFADIAFAFVFDAIFARRALMLSR
jgi:hypothetical protein